jgi:hypothetical protein
MALDKIILMTSGEEIQKFTSKFKFHVALNSICKHSTPINIFIRLTQIESGGIDPRFQALAAVPTPPEPIRHETVWISQNY